MGRKKIVKAQVDVESATEETAETTEGGSSESLQESVSVETVAAEVPAVVPVTTQIPREALHECLKILHGIYVSSNSVELRTKIKENTDTIRTFLDSLSE